MHAAVQNGIFDFGTALDHDIAHDNRISDDRPRHNLHTGSDDGIHYEDSGWEIFADAVAASGNTILIGELAKILKQNGINIGQQRLFGFLMSKNRLCVSMSREKKVLVVTGDKKLFTSEIAKTAVPELNAFIELCENNEFGKVISAKDIISGAGV